MNYKNSFNVSIKNLNRILWKIIKRLHPGYEHY